MIRTCFSLSFLRLRGLFMMATYVTQIRLKLEHVSPIKTCNFYSVSCHTLFLPCVCVCVTHNQCYLIFTMALLSRISNILYEIEKCTSIVCDLPSIFFYLTI